MGKGTAMARDLAPEHAAMIDDLKDQLLIVFLKRIKELGGSLSFPVTEVDDTGQNMLAFSIDEHKVFHFQIERKQ
jgi:hypothetical protein